MSDFNSWPKLVEQLKNLPKDTYVSELNINLISGDVSLECTNQLFKGGEPITQEDLDIVQKLVEEAEAPITSIKYRPIPNALKQTMGMYQQTQELIGKELDTAYNEEFPDQSK